jgi:ADP-ribose pyrophosphatase
MADPPGKRPLGALRPGYLVDDRWLRIRHARPAMADGTTPEPSTVIEHPDWVDVIALTADHRIVLIDQYRHAVGEVRTELPAGAVDGDEEPLAAAKRELLEETGYASEEWHLLGSAAVHPALQTNRIYSFLALNARRIADQALDEGEQIHCYEVPFGEFIDNVETGTVELPALQLAGLWWHSRKKAGSNS